MKWYVNHGYLNQSFPGVRKGPQKGGRRREEKGHERGQGLKGKWGGEE